MRNMFDFTFSAKPGEAKTLWLDLRDRILPAGKGFWITIAGAGTDFSTASLEGAEVRLVFKPREAARVEHELDRFTQAKDSYAMLVEEHPHSPKYNLWNRFEADLTDLMRVNPNHYPGRNYAAAGLGWPPPPFKQPEPPDGVPLWAFRQVELLGRVKKFVLWYIDNRQIEYGDFGGGISDDVDLLNTWPGVALMGCEPEKIKKSLHALLEAAFKNGMFTDGLSTIQADELHGNEEGIDCLGANLILDYGNPKQIERAMNTARGVERITGINAAGHRHIRTCYYNGKKIAEDDPWNYAKGYSYLVLQPGQLLVDYNGNPTAKKSCSNLPTVCSRTATRTRMATTFCPARFISRMTKMARCLAVIFHGRCSGPRGSGVATTNTLTRFLICGTTGIMTVNANMLDLLDLRKDWGPRILSSEEGRPVESRANDGRGSARSNAYRSSSKDHFQWQLTGDKQYPGKTLRRAD